MRRKLLIAALLACLGSSVYALTVDEIIKKTIAARGNADVVSNLKTKILSGKTVMRGTEFPFTIQQKRPDMIRIETSIQGTQVVQAFDGETGWQISPMSGGRPQKMSIGQAGAFRSQADFDGPLMGFDKAGYNIELVGKEDSEGTAVYHLKLSIADDSLRAAAGDIVTHVYLDAESFLEVRVSQQGDLNGTPLTVDSYFGDYREVGGLMMYHSLVTKMGGQTVSQLNIEKIELNVEIDDSVFQLPQEE